MQNVLYFLFRYGYVLVFIFLEVFCFNLVVRYNPHQNSLFLKSSNYLSGWMLDKYESLSQYIGLTKVASSLAEENARLRTQLPNFKHISSNRVDTAVDSTTRQQYELIAAKVIGNNITGLDNYVTINEGLDKGIRKGMGIIQDNGVVGIVTDVNQKFARAVSMLNRDCKISVAVAKNNFFGTLYWPGGDPRFAKLGDIPKHATLNVGDQLITSGYSAIFPRGVVVGHITDFSVNGGSNFYDINVRLSNDLSRVNYVFVIRNLFSLEQLELQEEN
jgi:rod shape-determining protein MreC